jgi:hypothetical protein
MAGGSAVVSPTSAGGSPDLGLPSAGAELSLALPVTSSGYHPYGGGDPYYAKPPNE